METVASFDIGKKNFLNVNFLKILILFKKE
jgi:hypothetical protein